MKEELLQTLQSEFGLTKKDVLIISTLSKKEMTAEEICKATKIPRGKIYTFLNRLLKTTLIEKSLDFPAIYSVPKLEQKVLDFLNEEFEKFTKKQNQLINALVEEPIQGPDFELIDGKKEFIFKLMEMLAEENEFKYVLRYPSLPYLVYLAPIKEFLEIHNLIVNSREALTNTKDNAPLLLNNFYGKKFKEGDKFDFIVCRQSLDDFFKLIETRKGKLALNKKVSEIKVKLKKFNACISVLDEHFPLGVYLSKRKVITVLVSGGALTGVIHQKKEVIDFYNNLFNEMKERSYPISEYFSKNVGRKWIK